MERIFANFGKGKVQGETPTSLLGLRDSVRNVQIQYASSSLKYKNFLLGCLFFLQTISKKRELVYL